MIIPDLEGVKRTLQEFPFPVDVIIETTGYCNLRCIMCPYSSVKRPKGEMSFNTFKRIVDEIARENPATRIWLAIMGEPLMMKDRLIKMIVYAKKQGIVEVNVNTNAVFMTPDISQKLIAVKLDRVLASIDAATKSSYDKIRVGGDFDAVVRNVEELLRLKQKANADAPEIVVQFIVMDENENEVEQFKDYWLKRDAVVKIRPKLGWGDVVQSSVLDITAKKTERFPCAWLTRTVSIHWDGTFAQCDADYEGIYSPGSLAKQTIKELWNTEIARRRNRHWHNDYDFEPCKNCKDWLAGRSYFYYPEQGANGSITRNQVLDANIKLHTQLSDVYRETEPHYFPENVSRVETILSSLAKTKGRGSLLDVGCGAGFIIDIAKKYFASIQGIDITPAMLQKIDTTGIKGDIKLKIAEVEKIPFKDGSFDVCTAYAVLHHLYDLKPAFIEIYRVLKPGGIFYSDTDPNFYFWEAIKSLPENKLYSDIITRELQAVKHKDEELEKKYSVSPATLLAAEVLKHKKGGFREEEIREMLKKEVSKMRLRVVYIGA